MTMTTPERLYGLPWTEPEFLIVLHYYLKHRREPRHEGTSFVQELSRLLGRTIDSILMRMENYASIDPLVKDHRVGLVHINDLGRHLFEKWGNQPDALAQTAGVLIRQAQQRDVPTLFNPAPISIPKAFGRYELLDKLGEGASGVVFSCIETETGKAFAIKIIHPQIVRDAEGFHRFLREIYALKSLKHRNIITLHQDNLDSERSFPAFVMDLALYSLAAYVDEMHRLKETNERPILARSESEKIVFSAMNAVEALHTNQPKLIHRDVNPNNLLHLPNSEWVLADFGLAKFMSTAQFGKSFQTANPRGWGTLWFTAPEQYDNFMNCNEGTDIYSLGMLIWALFTTSGPPPSDSGLPKHLASVYSKATSRNPTERHASVDELRGEFVKAIKDDLQGSLWEK
jgi:protein kinase-like protein